MTAPAWKADECKSLAGSNPALSAPGNGYQTPQAVHGNQGLGGMGFRSRTQNRVGVEGVMSDPQEDSEDIYQEDPEYIQLMKDFEEWKARGVVAPMAVGRDWKPIWEEKLPLGITMLIPAHNQGWDWCRLLKDENGYYAKSKFGDTYRLAYGPNWHITSELPPQY